MLVKVYSVFDNKAGGYLMPYFAVNDAVASRMLETAVNNRSHDFFEHPEDFQLFCIGSWDEQEGKLEGVAPFHVVNAHALKRVEDVSGFDRNVAEGK